MLREERIDALLESAQTQSYNTAMELGQRGIRFVTFLTHIKFYFQQRYVTGVVMEGALRAPGLMADIVQVLVALTNIVDLGRKDNNQMNQKLSQNETIQKSEPADWSTGTGAERQEWFPPPAPTAAPTE